MKIPTDALKLYLATDAEISRYSLGAVRIEPDGDGAIAVATDGRMLAAIGWDCEQPVDAMIPGDVLKRLSQMDVGWELELVEADGKRCLRGGDVSVQYTDAEGRWPKWQESIKGSGHRSTQVDPAYLLAAARIVKAFCYDEELGRVSVSISIPEDGEHPLLITFNSGGRRAMIALMPMASAENNLNDAKVEWNAGTAVAGPLVDSEVQS